MQNWRSTWVYAPSGTINCSAFLSRPILPARLHAWQGADGQPTPFAHASCVTACRRCSQCVLLLSGAIESTTVAAQNLQLYKCRAMFHHFPTNRKTSNLITSAKILGHGHHRIILGQGVTLRKLCSAARNAGAFNAPAVPSEPLQTTQAAGTTGARQPGKRHRRCQAYPLVTTNIAIENGQFICDLPIRNGVFHGYAKLPEDNAIYLGLCNQLFY